jgi:hypothetical protein
MGERAAIGEAGPAIGGCPQRRPAPGLADAAVHQSPVAHAATVGERWTLPCVMGGRRRGRALPCEQRAIGALHDLSRRRVAARRRLAHDQHERDDGDPG